MKKYIPLTIGILLVTFLLGFAFKYGLAQEANPDSGRAISPESPSSRSNYIPIQGRLTDASGIPLNGNYDVTFRLYDVLTAGTALCTSSSTNIPVENGLFNAYIELAGCAAIDGRQLYLSVQVGTDPEMTPRQYIDNVPYAWTLRPGANISGTIGTDAILDIDNYSPTGRGLRAEAQAATGINYAVIGAARSVDGFGGYFYNNGGGVGLYASTTATNNYSLIGMQEGYSTNDYTKTYLSGAIFGGVNGVIGISHETVPVGAGVYGWAQAATSTSYGVHGQADSTSGYGVFGNATAGTGLTRGVYGASASTSGRGVYGYASSTSGTVYGVYGESNSTSGRGVYGLADVSGGIGVMGESEVGSGVHGKSTSGYGVYGLSSTSNALYGDTLNASHNYGVYTPDNLYSLNYTLAGAVMQVVQNGGIEPLEAGDVVVFSGMIAPTDVNEPPVILVSKATTANSTAVAGVVYSRYNLENAAEMEGAAQPGESLLVVVQGPARVKVSVTSNTIQVGDLLTSSQHAGVAANAAMITMQGYETSLPGTIFAKALEALESGESMIYVYVTLR